MRRTSQEVQIAWAEQHGLRDLLQVVVQNRSILRRDVVDAKVCSSDGQFVHPVQTTRAATFVIDSNIAVGGQIVGVPPAIDESQPTHRCLYAQRRIAIRVRTPA